MTACIKKRSISNKPPNDASQGLRKTRQTKHKIGRNKDLMNIRT
jgi:hypothetical protein